MSGSDSPKITVLMSVFNGADFLRESIESILSQEYCNFLFRIVDDGSTDSTPEILGEYAGRDSRIRLVRQENRGLTLTLIEQMRLIDTPFVSRQDADDISLPARLSEQFEWFNNHPGGVLCGTNARLLNAEGEAFCETRLPTSDASLRKALCIKNCLFHSSAMFRRDAYAACGGYQQYFRYAQDYDLWCRLSARGVIGNVEHPLILRRLHGGAISQSNMAEQQHYAAVASTLHYARIAYKMDLAPDTRMDDGIFFDDEKLNRLLHMHYSAFITAHQLGSGESDIRASRWKLFRQAMHIGDSGMRARFCLYALLGPETYRRLRESRLIRSLGKHFLK
jgi:glycosyltransferase involved in cell wall biosynthesis